MARAGSPTERATLTRTLVLGGAVLLVALLAFLTLSVAIEYGITPLVLLSLLLIVVLGFGVLGALTSERDE